MSPLAGSAIWNTRSSSAPGAVMSIATASMLSTSAFKFGACCCCSDVNAASGPSAVAVDLDLRVRGVRGGLTAGDSGSAECSRYGPTGVVGGDKPTWPACGDTVVSKLVSFDGGCGEVASTACSRLCLVLRPPRLVMLDGWASRPPAAGSRCSSRGVAGLRCRRSRALGLGWAADGDDADDEGGDGQPAAPR